MRFPEYIMLGEHTEMRLISVDGKIDTCFGEKATYYRDAGDWEIDVIEKVEDDSIEAIRERVIKFSLYDLDSKLEPSPFGTTAHLRSAKVTEISEAEWYEANRQYLPKDWNSNEYRSTIPRIVGRNTFQGTPNYRPDRHRHV